MPKGSVNGLLKQTLYLIMEAPLHFGVVRSVESARWSSCSNNMLQYSSALIGKAKTPLSAGHSFSTMLITENLQAQIAEHIFQ